MSNKNKIIMGLLGIIVVAVGAVLINNLILNKAPVSSTAITPPPPASHGANASETRQLIADKATVAIPPTKTSAPVSQSNLPNGLGLLILSTAQNQSLTSEVYSDGHTGYSFTYISPDNVEATHSALIKILRSKPFVFTDGIRTDYGALLEGKSDKYNVKVVLEFVADLETQVTIQIVSLTL